MKPASLRQMRASAGSGPSDQFQLLQPASERTVCTLMNEISATGGSDEPDSCSATDIGATAHWADRFLSVEKSAVETSATGGRQRFSPSPATGGVLTRRSIPIRQMSKPGTITGMIPGFDVEHRRFELLTPTLPVLCATNCANAPNSGYLITSFRVCKALFSFPSLLLCDKMTEKERGMNDLV